MGLQVAVALFLLEGCTDGIHCCWWDLLFRNYMLVLTTYKDKIFSYWNNDFSRLFLSYPYTCSKSATKGADILKNIFPNIHWVNLIYGRHFETEHEIEHSVQDRLLKRESDINLLKRKIFLSLRRKILFHV